ncbi:hypothetical protein NQ318_001779 [Aromia moschata]|uniref:GPI ethanolamine phosphate transferase 3, catalytic subunit n=1 Tax=Aromia moschata TaxID=1265417 RepID=A0AAV8XGU9_9CUCU|nr:hypothetical protein NQ318_001779 [Aromia moschata]
MKKYLCYFLFLLWLYYLIISSVLLFTRGFLLSRVVQKVNSTCLSHSEIPCPSKGSSYFNVSKSAVEQCSQKEKIVSVLSEYNSASSICLPPKARIVLLIVDALRYDFTVYDENNNNPLPFQNKLPTIHRLRSKHPELTRLYKFIADPPTTTMQRLKGLTTGSLPTFIDAGSNFATSEINEDNIIDQLLKNNYNVVFMGDDTWNGLYPNRFMRNYPYPSFNVWDLDTVDNGVRDNLYRELNNTDWNLLIGHFLGVDHCGHRYGPNHPEMERKLGEINTVLENVVEQIDEHTMLFVIGDHGMTSTGDHGGESVDEVTAGLFVYSKQPLLDLGENKDTVKQVDLVPTLSTILGVPIPFQNLGILMLNCLPMSNISGVENWRSALYSLWANVQQVLNYIREYSETTDTFSEESLSTFYHTFTVLSGKIYSVNDGGTFHYTSKELIEFVSNLRQLCEDVWIQFDSLSMTRGLLFLFLTLFFVFIIMDGIPVYRLSEIFVSSFLLCSYLAVFVAACFGVALYYFEAVDNLSSTILFTTGVISQLMLVMLIIPNWEVISLNWYCKSKTERIPNLICRIVIAFNLCGLFSNSYIIEESFVLLFLLITVILVGTMGIIAAIPKVEGRQKAQAANTVKWYKIKLLLLAALIAALVRVSMYFWRCREEQQWCFASPHEVSNITAKMETTKLQWGITVVCLAIFVFATKEWLRHGGNLDGYSMTVAAVKFIPTVVVVCIAGYWVLRRLPSNNEQFNPLKSVNGLAWTIYGLTSVGILSAIINPLCIYVAPGRDSLVEVQNDEKVIPNLFRKVKTFLNEREEPKEDVRIVWGLATVYSSVFVVVGIYLTLLFGLLLGDAVAPSAVIMFMTTAFILIIMSVLRIEKVNTVDELFDVPNISVIVWIILAQYFFYGSGHQPTFPNISWEAAFIGTSGVFSNNFIPGALIIINTFCSYILMGVLLPLVLIMPFTIFVKAPSIAGKKSELQQATSVGEMGLFAKADLMFTSVFTLSCKYILGHGIRVFASMLAATIHCRHLMVWNIFAPKLIFEAIGLFVTLASVTCGYLILVRVNKKVETLVTVTLKKTS